MKRFDFEQIDRDEWRQLGYYYELNDEEDSWNLYGDRLGLNNLYIKLQDYFSSKKNEAIGEHDHLGPYQYLKIATWSDPKICEQGIFGSLVDLKRFAELFKFKLDRTSVNSQFTIDHEYSSVNTAKITGHVMPDGFDPSSMDRAN